MHSVQEAEAIIFNLIKAFNHQTDIETVDLLNADGRVLATPITSELDFPHWDNSAMDGYAVRYADVEKCTAEKAIALEIVEEIPAGYQPQSTIQSGQAAQIFTGAVMPPGADTVVMQENTRREKNQVFITSTPKSEEFVRKRASYYQAGEELLSAGITLKSTEIAVLAAAQCTQVQVYRRPRIGILSTGNELITPEQPLKPGQIVDSNQYALSALIKEMGAESLILGIIPDEKAALERAIGNAVNNADVVISSGGVSVGEYDYVKNIIESLGGKIQISSVAVKPGKPLTVANFPNCIYFGLPGNPVSALVTFWRFVQPVIKKLSGIKDSWQPEFLQAVTSQDLRSNGKRETYLWGKLILKDGLYQFQLAGGSHSSGNLINITQTNALACLGVGESLIQEGKKVKVLRVG
ncbi:MAG: gephyrin-like molybdotransferase Glp [Cyanobacteria bacterium P01_A01_bin.45]|mgnify:CR=1 FL=1